MLHFASSRSKCYYRYGTEAEWHDIAAACTKPMCFRLPDMRPADNVVGDTQIEFALVCVVVMRDINDRYSSLTTKVLTLAYPATARRC